MDLKIEPKLLSIVKRFRRMKDGPFRLTQYSQVWVQSTLTFIRLQLIEEA